MGIPIVNNRAFGFVTLMGAPVSPVLPRTASLGNPMGPMIGDTELDHNQASSFYNGIKNKYNDLVELVGQPEADNILNQAKSFYEEASKAWKSKRPGTV